MPQTVEADLAELRLAVSAKSDADLARKLGVKQSTISSWKARGRIPERFLEVARPPSERPSPTAPRIGGDYTDRATAVALVRYIILREAQALSADPDQVMGQFLDLRPFWLVMHRALHDIRLKMEAMGVDVAAAQALVMQEDLRDPGKTRERVAMELAEDLADNPWISAQA